MELDQNSRWFKLTNETVAKPLSKSDKSYSDVVDFVVDAGREVKRDEILKALNMTDATLTRKLSLAVKNGDLIQTRNGYYSAPDIESENSKGETEDCRIFQPKILYCKPNQELAMKK